MTTLWFVLTRAVHFSACLLFFGIFVFDRFVVASIRSDQQMPIRDYWWARMRLLSQICLPAILLSGIAWFALVTLSMSGQPLATALKLDTLKIVWNQTVFGTVWKWRTLFWLAAAVTAVLVWVSNRESSLRKISIWLELALGILLLGSLAWAGHGLEGSPAHWHLLADVLHLLVAGVWPTGLLPIALLLREAARDSDVGTIARTAYLVQRFSALSLASVALLAISGWINGLFLVGSFANLFQQTYGHWLLAKIILFGMAVCIGMVNFLRLKPKMLRENTAQVNSPAVLHRLQNNVQWELFLSTAILVVVAVLGLLPPAIH